jgi:hypothetical protein
MDACPTVPSTDFSSAVSSRTSPPRGHLVASTVADVKCRGSVSRRVPRNCVPSFRERAGGRIHGLPAPTVRCDDLYARRKRKGKRRQLGQVSALRFHADSGPPVDAGAELDLTDPAEVSRTRVGERIAVRAPARLAAQPGTGDRGETPRPERSPIRRRRRPCSRRLRADHRSRRPGWPRPSASPSGSASLAVLGAFA